MTLAAIQNRFLASVTATGPTAIAGWPISMHDGLDVYRNAYRSRLLDCLRGAFDKSRKWIGDESFDAAAAHHLILHPPTSWTLDDLGLGFSDTLAALFPNDPEVEELAWLEWEMQRLFTGPDGAVMTAADFAWRASAFSEADWLALRLGFTANIALRRVRTDCAALWSAIDEGKHVPDLAPFLSAFHLLVWRNQLRTEFRLITEDEANGLDLMRSGASFEHLCDAMVQSNGYAQGVAAAGTMLGRWMADGLVADIATEAS